MKIDFLINLAENLDSNKFKSWKEAVEFYYNLINFSDTIDSDFFSLLYLISDGDSGLIIGEDYGYELEYELEHFFPHEDWIFENIVNSDIDTLEERSVCLSEDLFSFYKSIESTDLGSNFILKYRYRLVEELISKLYIYDTREEIIGSLGTYILNKLIYYNLL